MTEGPPDQSAAGDPATGADPSIHLVIRASSGAEQDTLQAWLAEQRLDPQVAWAAESLVSFRLSTSDAGAVRELMAGRPDIGWTVVSPGEADYLFRQLFVEGPDGRRFRLRDVPAAIPIGSIATETLDQYPESGTPGRPAVVDQVDQSGEGRRLDPDTSLAEQGVRDGDQLRVGFQARAG